LSGDLTVADAKAWHNDSISDERKKTYEDALSGYED